MLSKISSYVVYGIDGLKIDVEIDATRGLPHFEMVGLADVAVKESKERVQSAIKNSGRKFPVKKIIANLAPADIKKEGTSLDLAIAIGILESDEQIISNEINEIVFLGELSLDGSLRHINGIMPMIISAYKQGFKKFIVPFQNAKEACFLDGVEVYALNNLNEVVDHLSNFNRQQPLEKTSFISAIKNANYKQDLKYIKGQKVAKRALEIAVSGGHNILFVGPPGTGKTMLAKCIPTIMPDLTLKEALECTKIHSVSGKIKEGEGILSVRPFRTPHHTATTISLMGGGKNIRPGEISLSHNGVLFLDEMPEYNRSTLEALRQPLEDGVITITRANANFTFPANFILCGSMNPCPCGNLGSSTNKCVCSSNQIAKYKAKLSSPLLDRIDIQVSVDSIKYDDLVNNQLEEDSQTVKERVDRARAIQIERFKEDDILTNANMSEKEIRKYCKLSSESEMVLKNAYTTLNFSARARSRILKVARTIADMELSENIQTSHLLEAINYRHS